MIRILSIWLLGLLALFALTSCALTTKAQPTVPRFFSPEPTQGQTQAQAQAALPRVEQPVELRLGRVQAAAHIREKIIYRNSPNEFGFYDDLLWTERPEAYLRRALTQTLFEEEGVRSIVSGAGSTLDVELVSFEEIRKPQHLAQVRVTLVLRDDRAVRLEQTLTVERPIPSVDKSQLPGAIAAALGDALRSAVVQISERVLPQLPPATPPSSSGTGTATATAAQAAAK